MKVKIASFVRVSEHSMVASVRIARFIQDIVGCSLHWPISYEGQKIWNEPIDDEPLDVLVIVGGAYAFAGNDVLESLASAIRDAKRIVWCQNDYTVIPPKVTGNAKSPFRAVFRERHEQGKEAVHFWTTVKNMSVPSSGRVESGFVFGEYSRYVNWNCLTFDPTEPVPFEEREFPDTMIYYGSYRNASTGRMTREPYFIRYFAEPSVSTVISSPSKKFRENFDHPKIVHIDKLPDLQKDLAQFGLGLYIEDRKSHDEFHSPANRFYEMLSAGLPMVFQPESMGMLKRAGYDIGGSVAWGVDEIPKLLRKKHELFSQQRKDWMSVAAAERELLPEQVLESWGSLP